MRVGTVDRTTIAAPSSWVFRVSRHRRHSELVVAAFKALSQRLKTSQIGMFRTEVVQSDARRLAASVTSGRPGGLSGNC